MGSPSVLEAKTLRRWEPSNGRLLLVDENVKNLELYSALFLQRGYEVRSFSSYGEAAACLEREIFDLVVVTPGDHQP